MSTPRYGEVARQGATATLLTGLEVRLMNEIITPAPVLPGDFAGGERTDAPTPEEVREENLQGDFAANVRTETPTPEESLEEGLHGDFAAGERKEPLTPADDVPGTFSDTSR